MSELKEKNSDVARQHFYPDTEQNFLASWQAILDGVPLDILPPQDSIGCGCCSLYDQEL